MQEVTIDLSDLSKRIKNLGKILKDPENKEVFQPRKSVIEVLEKNKKFKK